MKNDEIDNAAKKLNEPVTGIAASTTYKASEVPVELDPATLPKEIIGELMRAGERAVIGSTSKSRKSWALLHLAICKAHGLPWLGHSMAAGKVLYIDLELIKVFFDRRMAAISKELKVKHSENLILWPLRNTRPKPKIKDLVEEVVKRFKDTGLELVILEPSYKMVESPTQGTNSETQVGEYLECLDEIAYPLQCAVLTSHHSPKGDLSGRSSIDLFSGTGVWARDPDLLMTMRPHEKEDHSIFDITRRHGAPIDPVVLSWGYPIHHIAGGEDPTKIRSAKSSQKTESTNKVLEVLAGAPEDGWRHSEWQQACERAHISSASFDRKRKELINANMVELLDHGNKKTYRIKNEKVPINCHIPF